MIVCVELAGNHTVPNWVAPAPGQKNSSGDWNRYFTST